MIHSSIRAIIKLVNCLMICARNGIGLLTHLYSGRCFFLTIIARSRYSSASSAFASSSDAAVFPVSTDILLLDF